MEMLGEGRPRKGGQALHYTGGMTVALGYYTQLQLSEATIYNCTPKRNRRLLKHTLPPNVLRKHS
jgi:hypothetical protein